MMQRRGRGAAWMMAAAAGLWGSSISAATKTWVNANGLEDWATASNWSLSGAPATGDAAVFPVGFPNADSSQSIVIATALCNSLSLADSYTMAGGTLAISGTGTIDVAATKTATIQSNLNGTAGLTKTGSGALVLGGTNSFSGGVNINGGRLQIDADSRMGNVNNDVTLNGGTLATTATFSTGSYARDMTIGAAGATFDAGDATTFTHVGVLRGSGAIVKAGLGTTKFDGDASSFTGAITVNSGTLQFRGFYHLAGTAPVSIASGARLYLGSWDTTSDRVITCNSATIAVEGGSLTLTSGLGATSGSLTKTEYGRLHLSAASSFSGNVTINGGTISVAHAAALGTGTSAVQVNNTGTIAIYNTTWGRNVSLANGSAMGMDGDSHYTGVATLATGATVDFSGYKLTFDAGSNITGGGSGALLRLQYGNLAMNTTPTYAGGWAVNWGRLEVTTHANLGTGTSTVALNASLGSAELAIGGTFARPIGMSGFSYLYGTTASAKTTAAVMLGTNNAYLAAEESGDVLTIGDSANDLTGIATTINIIGLGTVKLGAASSVLGTWRIDQSATLEADADDRLGNSANKIDFTGGRFRATGSFATSRSLTSSFSGGAVDAVPGATLTINSPWGIYGAIGGGGTVELTQAKSVDTSLSVENNSTLRLKHTTAVGAVSVNSGAAEISNVSFNGLIRLRDGAALRGTGASALNTLELSPFNAFPTENVYLNGGAIAGENLTINALTNGFTLMALHTTGNGTVIFGNATTFFGYVSMDSGTLRMTSVAALQAPLSMTLNGGTLEVPGSVNAATRHVAVSATGGGIATTSGAASVGNIAGSGPVTKSGAGTLTVNHMRAGALNVSVGTLAIAAGGGDAGTSRVSTLAIAGKLDLSNNKLIVTGQTVPQVEALIAAGRNGGSWNGAGVMTSQSAALNGVTTLATATATQLGKTSFGGLSVSGDDVLVRYTYAGDADLDGVIDGDDFANIDAGFSAHGSGYFRGDFNYSGTIDADDYWVIDRNYSRNLPALGGAAVVEGIGVTSVPEPGCGLLLSMAFASRLRRRMR